MIIQLTMIDRVIIMLEDMLSWSQRLGSDEVAEIEEVIDILRNVEENEI